MIDLRPNADAVWLSFTRITFLCYIVTRFTCSLRHMCKVIQALRAMPAVSNKITLLWQHWNLMRDEQMNICMGNVMFLDTVSCNPTPASAQSPLTPQRLFYYESRFHIRVTLHFSCNIRTNPWIFTTNGNISCCVDRASRYNSL